MNENLIFIAVSSALAAMALPRLLHRLELSRAKHPSLTGHSRMAKRFAAPVPFYS
jgi:glutamate-1-semialdehyde 2,1-aminomutase